MRTIFVICFILSSVLSIAADTNTVYVTDDGMLVAQNHSGGFRLNQRKVEAAKKLAECLPASEFPGGNWGSVNGGFQLSLRFETNVFAPGFPVVGIILLRNVTNCVLTYHAVGIQGRGGPIQLVVTDADGKSVPLKSDEINVISVRDVRLFPGTQQKFYERIDSIYNLPTNGIINIEAALKDIQSVKVPIKLQ